MLILHHDSVADKSVRYVAEENITPIDFNSTSSSTSLFSSASPSPSSSENEEEQPSPTPYPYPSPAMLALAGRHFKRWDAANHIFVSNIRDEYPDD